MLTELIARYKEAKKVWENQFDETDGEDANSVEWRAYMDLSCAIIDFRCSTLLQIQQKAKFILTDANLIDMLASCSTDAAVTDFLRSIVGDPVEKPTVEKSNNGGN